ncbi:MAG: hypothetical protein J2P41_05680 [Blastocatellia bacterium]|nr:hypothetical protein [Blastocatellia bacterium]
MMKQRKLSIVISLLWVITNAGCGAQLYKVAPLPASKSPEIATGNDRGLQLGAAVLEGDRSIEQFEANLPLAGVAAIDVKLVNQSSAAINAKRLRFALSDGDDNLKEIPPKKALSKVMHFYGINFYRVDARKRTQESYEAIALNLNGMITPGEARRGFLFFERGKNDSTSLRLTVTGDGSPISVEVGR